MGGPGSLSRALGDPGDSWRAHRNDAFFAGANQGPDSPGGGGPGDPWLAPSHMGPDGKIYYQAGYGPGAPQYPEIVRRPDGSVLPTGNSPSIPTIRWDGGEPPGKSLTLKGQNKMAQPFSIGNQQFTGGLQSLLDFLKVSTPQSQAIKQQLEKAGIFDEIAPYLNTNVNTPPDAATPFTDWNPMSLIKLLRQSGLLTRP